MDVPFLRLGGVFIKGAPAVLAMVVFWSSMRGMDVYRLGVLSPASFSQHGPEQWVPVIRQRHPIPHFLAESSAWGPRNS